MSSPDRAAVLQVRDLAVRYRTAAGPVVAVDGLGFDLSDGEAIALIGESGSGKSTVAMALMGLLPPNGETVGGFLGVRASSGTWQDLLSMSADHRRAFRWASCAMVPQGAINALNPVMRVREHFADTATAHGGLRGDALHRRADTLMRGVNLDPDIVLNAYPHELSGGMRQRVLIALALLLSPRILILDEPTTALDVVTQRAILDVLGELRQREGFALIFISHDLPVAADVADRVLTMYAGRLVEDVALHPPPPGPLHPYTDGLWRAVPTLDSLPGDLSAIPGSPPDLIDLPSGCAFHPRCPVAMDVCELTMPDLTSIHPGHSVACHRLAAPLATPGQRQGPQGVVND